MDLGTDIQKAARIFNSAARGVKTAQRAVKRARSLSRTIRRTRARLRSVRLRQKQKMTKAARRTKRPKPRQTKNILTAPAETVILVTRELRAHTFQWPEQGIGDTQRLGNAIRLSGLKINWQFKNNNSYPIVVHFAVVQPKDHIHDAAYDLNAEFFRDHTMTDEDNTMDFVNNTGTGGETWKPEYNDYPLNRTKFNIITHKKRILQDYNWESWKSTWIIKKFIPFKGKRFTFHDPTSDQPHDPIYVMWWWQCLLSNDWNRLDQNTVQNFQLGISWYPSL